MPPTAPCPSFLRYLFQAENAICPAQQPHVKYAVAQWALAVAGILSFATKNGCANGHQALLKMAWTVGPISTKIPQIQLL
jgi:hypothetical protein